MNPISLTLLLAASLTTPLLAAPDILLTDFEAKDYGDWKSEGTAFGPGPAKGTLPGQMKVSGFHHKQLVNSYHNKDASTGKLTSPPFKIERPFLNFLIGGGGYKGKTCMNLLVDGNIVRTATGPNTNSGGSEALLPSAWDLSEFIGKQAVIEIVDNHTGGWGHINIDHLVQSETGKIAGPANYSFTAQKRYLHLPVKTGAPKLRAKLFHADTTVRELDIELAGDQPPSFIAALDLSKFHGKKLSLQFAKTLSPDTIFTGLTQSDQLPNADNIYREKHRPLFHFTSKIGWLNDPNGLVHHDGTWHLYYQHNPYGWNWGNMHWGHAVSTDLFHWKEQGDKIFPWSDCKGAAFSGGAVIDTENTSGFGKNALVASLTDTGSGECIAYSNDNGKSFTMFNGNPVVKHKGRDPKIIYYAPGQHWVMALYNEHEGKQWITFHSSPDLKTWKLESRIADYYECPEIFELPVDNDPHNTRWVLFGADAKYAVGSFDGKSFTPEHEGKHQLWHGNFYASQTYSNSPHGRRIQIGWGRCAFPGMPFNQQMAIPTELTLTKTDHGIRLLGNPVKELESIRSSSKTFPDLPLTDETQEWQAESEALELITRLQDIDCKLIEIGLRGKTLSYDPGQALLTIDKLNIPAPLNNDGALDLRILLDRGSIEIFVNHGQAAALHACILDPENLTLSATVKGGSATFAKSSAHILSSIWE